MICEAYIAEALGHKPSAIAMHLPEISADHWGSLALGSILTLALIIAAV